MLYTGQACPGAGLIQVMETWKTFINLAHFPEPGVESCQVEWRLGKEPAGARSGASGGTGQGAAMRTLGLETKQPSPSVRVDLEGRLFLKDDEREGDCRITELSPDGASLVCEVVCGAGAPVVLYVKGLSRFEGTITHCDGNVFEVKFASSPAKRERTAELIAAMGDKGLEGGAILRWRERAERKGGIAFTRANGQVLSCEIIDISVNGVSLRTEIRPPIGELVLIAQTAGRISRYHEDGIGIEFLGKAVLKPQPWTGRA